MPLKRYGNVREGFPKFWQEGVHVGLCLRRAAVQINGISYHKSNDSLFLSISFEIFYYLCRVYRIKSLSKDPKGVAYCKAGTFEPKIYAYYPVH